MLSKECKRQGPCHNITKSSECLAPKLDLLFTSRQVGNTGVRNESVAICNELKRKGAITDNEYKDLQHTHARTHTLYY